MHTNLPARLLAPLLCLWLGSCGPAPLLAQGSSNQARNWNFGQSVSLSFRGGRPVLNEPAPLNAFEGAASLSDERGRLQCAGGGPG